MTGTKSLFRFIMVLLALVFVTSMAGIQGKAFAADAKATKLPADGGEPGKDYMTYVKALHKKDGATIRKMAEVPAGTSEKELKGQMDMMAAMTPSDQKIVSGSMKGASATLNVTGIMDGKKQYGTVELQKKGSRWKITKEDWRESPGK